MNNPLNNQVTDSRDLLEYRDFLATQLTDNWNSLEGNEDFQADDVNEILGADGFEFADNVKEIFVEFEDQFADEIEHYNAINDLCEEMRGCSDFQYGESIIHENYFTDYTQELCEDMGYISKDFPTWIEIDWEATAQNVMVDYSEFTFDGDTYYICS